MANVVGVTLELGLLVITIDGQRTGLHLADVLRAADIPTGLNHTQVQAITALANLTAVLIRTLIDRQVLDESFMEHDELDLDHIVGAIEDMGGAYHEPDITVQK